MKQSFNRLLDRIHNAPVESPRNEILVAEAELPYEAEARSAARITGAVAVLDLGIVIMDELLDHRLLLRDYFRKMLYTNGRDLLKRFPRKVARGAVFVAASVFFFAPAPTLARKHGPPSTGLRNISFAKPAPDFTFDIGAGETHLAALAGHPVVLSFWATWCEPCRAELPAFGRIQTTFGDSVRILTISDEPPGRARTFLEAQHLDMPVVEDTERKIFQAYSVTPIPVTLVLDSGGTVVYVSIGETSFEELSGAIASALAAPARSAAPAR